MKRYNKQRLLDALNRIDEFACMYDGLCDNDNGEAQQLQKDYNLVFNFINEHNPCEKKGCDNIALTKFEDYCPTHY